MVMILTNFNQWRADYGRGDAAATPQKGVGGSSGGWVPTKGKRKREKKKGGERRKKRKEGEKGRKYDI